jgi:hypothetical protein
MWNLRCFFRALGVAVQVLVLGELLFVAVITMYASSTGAQVFRYAGF